MTALMVVGFVTLASAKDLSVPGNPVTVSPIRAMGVVMNADGSVTATTDWIELKNSDGPGQASDLELFDAFENDEGDFGFPTDFCCGLGASRWYFGETYCNQFAVADMQATANDSALRVEFAWFWYVSGAGSSEQCFVAVFTGDFFESNCGDDPPYSLGPGIVYDFGVLDSNAAGGYYFADMDLDGTGLFHDVFTDGSYGVILANAFDGQTLTLATCAQPMLWGNKSLDGCKDLAGSHGNIQYDDDNPVDGQHDIVNECYDYAFGICPDPLTAMIGFGNGIGSGICTGSEKIKKTKCKTKNDAVKKIIVKAKGCEPGAEYTVTLDDGQSQDRVANTRGKVTAKFKNHLCGGGTATLSRGGQDCVNEIFDCDCQSCQVALPVLQRCGDCRWTCVYEVTSTIGDCDFSVGDSFDVACPWGGTCPKLDGCWVVLCEDDNCQLQISEWYPCSFGQGTDDVFWVIANCP